MAGHSCSSLQLWAHTPLRLCMWVTRSFVILSLAFNPSPCSILILLFPDISWTLTYSLTPENLPLAQSLSWSPLAPCRALPEPPMCSRNTCLFPLTALPTRHGKCPLICLSYAVDQRFSDMSVHQSHHRGLLKHRWLDPTPKSFWFRSSWWAGRYPQMDISNKILDDADPVSLWMLCEPCSRK